MKVFKRFLAVFLCVLFVVPMVVTTGLTSNAAGYVNTTFSGWKLIGCLFYNPSDNRIWVDSGFWTNPNSSSNNVQAGCVYPSFSAAGLFVSTTKQAVSNFKIVATFDVNAWGSGYEGYGYRDQAAVGFRNADINDLPDVLASGYRSFPSFTGGSVEIHLWYEAGVTGYLYWALYKEGTKVGSDHIISGPTSSHTYEFRRKGLDKTSKEQTFEVYIDNAAQGETFVWDSNDLAYAYAGMMIADNASGDDTNKWIRVQSVNGTNAKSLTSAHSHSYTVKEAATCTEKGYKECSCGAVTPISALKHSYSDWSTQTNYDQRLCANDNNHYQKRVNVTYNANGGSGAPSATTSSTLESTTSTASIASAVCSGTISSTEPTRSNYTFEGWATSQARANNGNVDYAPGASYTSASNLNLYAVWTQNTNYTVTFDNAGGRLTSTPPAQTVSSGNKATAPSATANSTYGSTVIGWTTDTDAKAANGTAALYDFNTAVTGNITLRPVVGWTVNLVNGPEGQSASKTLYKFKDVALTLPTSSARCDSTAYTNSTLSSYGFKPTTAHTGENQRSFMEWNTSYNSTSHRGNGTSYWNSYTANANATLYAMFGYPVIFNADTGGHFEDSNGNKINTGTLGDQYFESYVATYTHSGETQYARYYYCIPDGVASTDQYGVVTPVNGNHTQLTGHHSTNEGEKPVYFLYWNGNNGVDTETQDHYMTIYAGQWTEYGVPQMTNSHGQTAPVLLAAWNNEVNYNANGGSGSYSATLKRVYTRTYDFKDLDLHDEDPNVHNVLSLAATGITGPTGKVFAGWNTAADGSGTAYAAGSTYSGAIGSLTPVTLYAQWKDSYTVSYNANGGSGSIADATKINGTALTLSDGSGFTGPQVTVNFDVSNGGTVNQASKSANRAITGWKTAANSGTSYALSGSYTANAAATMYAQWGAVTIDSFPTPTPPTGFTFKGWYENSAGTGSPVTSWEFTAANGTATKTLYAVYQVNTFTVTWKNDDGTTLETDTGVAYGATPSYDGQTPTKADDGHYHYTFTGWSPAISSVTGNVTYTAQFSSAANTYTVVWKNHDGTTLETDTGVAYGVTPTYDGETPTKAGNAQYSYTFDAWTPAVTSTSGTHGSTITYTATFTENVNTYTITWVNEGGTTLETDTGVAYGATPEYNGATPTKADDGHYHYTFTGWSPAISSVTGNVTYTAQFSSAANTYKVVWKNHDGTTLETDNNVAYGVTPTYDGETPTKAATAQYTYTFDTWTPAVTSTSGTHGSTITYTATFTETVNTYTVRWYDQDGTLLETDNDVAYGTAPSFGGTEPAKDSTAQYVFTFAGWADEEGAEAGTSEANLPTVSGNVDYYAAFSKATRTYDVLWKSQDGSETLYTSVGVEYGTVPTFGGTEPTKAATAQYTYTFAGWANSANQTAAVTISAVNGTPATLIYYAAFSETVVTYTVSFDMNGHGDQIASQTVAYGDTVEEPAVSTVSGYVFVGWYTDDSFVTLWNFESGTVTGDLTLVAKWDTVALKMDGKSLLITSGIQMAFYLDAEQFDSVFDYDTVVFRAKFVNQNGSAGSWQTLDKPANSTQVSGVDGKSYQFVFDNINPAHMGETIEFTITAQRKEADRAVDSTTYKLEGTYSVAQYCCKQIKTAYGQSGDYYRAVERLCAAIMLYGDKSEPYAYKEHSYTTETAVADKALALLKEYEYKGSVSLESASALLSGLETLRNTGLSGRTHNAVTSAEGKNASGFKWRGAKLFLQDRIQIKVEFTYSGGGNLSASAYNPATKQPTTLPVTYDNDHGWYYVIYDLINPTQFDKDIAISIVDGSGTRISTIVHYTVDAYIDRMNKNDGSMLAELVDSIDKYADAVIGYVNALS